MANHGVLAKQYGQWHEISYYHAIDRWLQARRLSLSALVRHGIDDEFRNQIFRYYRYGYLTGETAGSVAQAVAQALSLYDRDRNLAAASLGGTPQPARSCVPVPAPASATGCPVGAPDLSARPEHLAENLRIISSVTAQILTEIALETDAEGGAGLRGALGTFGYGLARVSQASVTLLVFGIHSICRIQRDPAYLDSGEYQATRRALLAAIVGRDRETLARLGSACDPERLRRDLEGEMAECERNVLYFCHQYRAGSEASAESALLHTFEARTGMREIACRPLAQIFREYFRITYDLIHSTPEARP